MGKLFLIIAKNRPHCQLPSRRLPRNGQLEVDHAAI
jgi:hypothetical protein